MLRCAKVRALAIAVWIVAIAVARIVATYPQIGITYDEPVHLACGTQFLAEHVYQIEAQHPPLARVAAAVGPYLAGVRPAGASFSAEEGLSELYQDGRVRWHLALDRIGILPFFVLACLVVFVWARRDFGDVAAAIAVAVFTLVPSVLAHAGLGTTDMPLTACTGATFLALIVWAERPTRGHAVLLGVAGGLAVLSKFTSLIYVPASALLALAAWLAATRPRPRLVLKVARERAASFGLALAAAAIVVWAGYLFSYGPVEGWSVSVPAPELFAGIKQVLVHNTEGHLAYFFGDLRTEGWWYFFPVMLAMKTPLALLLAAAGGLALVWRHRTSPRYWLPVALILGTLGPAMAGRINIGTRHVLPVYLGLSILAGLALERMLRHRRARFAAAALLLWLAVSGALHHPDYISYFDEFVTHPEEVTADSDLDWGQGTVLLARRLKQLGVTQATCSMWALSPERLRTWPGLNCKPLLPKEPATGWVVVSPTGWRLMQYEFEDVAAGTPLWFENWKPVQRIGGLLLYYHPPLKGRGSTVAVTRPAVRARP